MSMDMSPHAVTARLRLVSELRDLCLALGYDKANEPGPAHPVGSPDRSRRYTKAVRRAQAAQAFAAMQARVVIDANILVSNTR